MGIALGGNQINKAYLGGAEIQKMYLGSSLVFDSTQSLLKPIMTNFRTDDTNKNRIYFDTPLGTVLGIDYQDFTIDGKAITAVNTTDNYFTLSADLNYYDNILIRKEGGNNTVVYDFTLQYIENLIDEPSANTIRYAAPTTQGSGSGLDEANAWSYADAGQNATAGMTVNMLAGTTSTDMIIANNGDDVSGPIKFVGYNNDGKDVNRTKSIGMAMDATIMPLLQNMTDAINMIDQSYIIIRNIQFFNNSNYAISTKNSTNCVFDNIYASDGKRGAGGVNSDDTFNNRFTNSYVADMSASGFTITGKNNAILNTWGVTSKSTGMDYYFSVLGTLDGGYSIVRDCYINRYSGDSHNGHGVSLKANETSNKLEYCLVENITVINTRMEFRQHGTKNNVMRNISATGTVASPNQNAHCIVFRDDCSYNIVEDSSGDNLYDCILFYENNDEDGGIQAGGHYNKVINCVFSNSRYAILNSATSSSAPHSPPLESTFNEIINTTFSNIDDMYADGISGSLGFPSSNKLINCIFDKINSRGSGVFNPVFSYSDFYSDIGSDWSYTAEAGTGNFVENPLLDSSFVPQATFTDIDVPRIDGVFFDKNGGERSNPTTVGAVKSDEEEQIDIPFEIVSYEITEITQTTARVITYINEQCSINFYVDGIKNAASSDDFNASSGWPAPGTFRHGRTLTDLTPGTTSNLIIEVTAQDDGEVVQSENIPLTTLP